MRMVIYINRGAPDIDSGLLPSFFIYMLRIPSMIEIHRNFLCVVG